MQAFQDPEVAEAMQDISKNPANISKYQDNPKIKNLINKMSSSFQAGPDVEGGTENEAASDATPSSHQSAPHQPDVD